MKKEPEIHCPRCGYRPQAEDRWRCVPSCAASWHTFWTGGVCPGCGIRWYKTQCPACGEVSPHKDWYHDPQDESETTEERELERS
jgi:hypothetical protein